MSVSLRRGIPWKDLRMTGICLVTDDGFTVDHLAPSTAPLTKSASNQLHGLVHRELPKHRYAQALDRPVHATAARIVMLSRRGAAAQA